MFRRSLILTGLVLLFGCFVSGRAWGQACREVAIVFQPDCFRPSVSAPCNPDRNGSQLDMGPQIAVWVTGADGKQFVDTLMVTNLTARFGIGNRPGRWDFGSGPKFPYGKRINVLPVWAHARGRVYDTLVMQDGQEGFLGFHESVSSPDPYFCKPLNMEQVVDAVTCPTAVFPSAKGRFDPKQKSHYPPRNDLTTFTLQDCDFPPGDRPDNQCPSASAKLFSMINDLDEVSAATPAYESVYTLRWRLPGGLSPGRYHVMVEVNKEFDQNEFHKYPADGTVGYTHPLIDITDNIGQPSVVYQVALDVGTTADSYGAATTIVGYGDWNGATGTLHPRDYTISNQPGSGIGRLLTIVNPWDSSQPPARVHAVTLACENPDAGDPCEPPPPGPTPPSTLVAQAVDAVSATLMFTHAQMPDGGPVLGYEIRYMAGETMSDADFLNAIPIAAVSPGPPGTQAATTIQNLRELTHYMVGVRALGSCGVRSPLAVASFETKQMMFTTLKGCFIATAAHGSTLAPAISSLRWARDRVLTSSIPGQTAVELYYRNSPPLAESLAGDETARAVVRYAIQPLVDLAALARAWSSQ